MIPARRRGENAPTTPAGGVVAARSDAGDPGVGHAGTRLRHDDERSDMAAIDPVCGMTVEESDAPDKLDHEGTTYYFCSTDCREEFEANPGDYAS